jgi:hypothetical protein
MLRETPVEIRQFPQHMCLLPAVFSLGFADPESVHQSLLLTETVEPSVDWRAFYLLSSSVHSRISNRRFYIKLLMTYNSWPFVAPRFIKVTVTSLGIDRSRIRLGGWLINKPT